MRRFLLVVLGVVGIALLPSLAGAQIGLGGGEEASETVTLPDPLTPEAVREMVSTLSDEQVRTLLLERLDAVAQEAEAASAAQERSLGAFARTATVGVYQSVATAIKAVPLLWENQRTAFVNFSERLGSDGLTAFLGALIAALALGLAAEFAVTRFVRARFGDNDPEAAPGSLGATLKFLFTRLRREALGLVVFAVVVGIAAEILTDEALHPITFSLLLNMIIFPRAMAALSRFLLAPNRSEFRLVNTDDRTARVLHRNMIGLVILIGFTFAIVVFNHWNGIAMGESRLGFWLNLATHLYLIWIVLANREGLVLMMRGKSDEITPMEEKVARAYPWFAVGVVVASWFLVEIVAAFGLFELLLTAPHIWTMFLLLMAPTLDTAIRGLVHHLTPPMQGEGAIAERAYHATKASLIRIGRVVVFVVVMLLIASVWRIDFHNFAASGVGARVASGIIEFMIVAAFGYFVYEVVSLLINRRLAAEYTASGVDPHSEDGGGEIGGTGGSRLSTILPLVLGVSKAAILVIFGLVAIGGLGIDITPLLAGAGIIGLAIGFGAQKLVADVVSGIFFLLDDAFRTGEYVDVGGTMGSIEKISLRSLQLRHHRGPVHTVPYGEIPKITNYSRDWAIMKLKFTVPFDTDPNQIKKIFKRIGQEMLEDPDFGDDFLQPFKSQGVFAFDDVGMIVRGKFMAKPGKQFVLRKEIYNRIKSEFSAAGIDFARREVRVAIPGLEGDHDLTPEQKTNVAQAAAQAAQDSIEEAEEAAAAEKAKAG
ncbi:MAG: mechanosensitive ion channel domain-containing protein [Pseudomonadota bacterium]